MQTRRQHRGSAPPARRCRSRGCWRASPRASGPTRSREALGKSVSTAYNLLASLCDEGVAERRPGSVYRLTTLFRETVAEQADRHDLSGVVDDLLARTHKRAYLAVIRAGQLRVVLERGMQGMPKLPGMRPEIEDNAHALALGKVVLALEPREAVERYAARRPQALHPAHHHRPGALHDELRDVRLGGVAAECEEFGKDFCCLAAPDPRPPAALPRRRRHLDVPPRVRHRARRARGDAARRRAIPSICGSSRSS